MSFLISLRIIQNIKVKIVGIYKIQSILKPDRIYIGSALDIKTRWRGHRFDLKNNKHHSIKLQRHYNKYGLSDLVFAIVTICDKKDLIEIEQKYIDINNPYFNCCLIAGNCTNRKLSDDTKRKISEANKDRKGQIPWNKGLKHSDFTKLKIAITMTGKKRKPLTEEHKEKLRKAFSGINNPMYGRPPSNKKTA